MLVVDASAIVRAIVAIPPADDVRARLDRDGDLAAPHLIDLEVLQALRRFVRHGDLTVDRARVAIDDFIDLDLTKYPHEAFLDRIWQLRDALSTYDAAYLALAEVLDVPLVTSDAALAKVASTNAGVELYAPAD